MVLFWYISTGAQNVQTKHWLQISCFAFLACFVNPLSGIPVHLSSPCVLQKVNRNVKNDGPRPEVCICTSWMMTEAPSCNTMLVFCRRCFYSFVHPLYNTGKSAVVLKWSLPSSQNASGMTWMDLMNGLKQNNTSFLLLSGVHVNVSTLRRQSLFPDETWNIF